MAKFVTEKCEVQFFLKKIYGKFDFDRERKNFAITGDEIKADEDLDLSD